MYSGENDVSNGATLSLDPHCVVDSIVIDKPETNEHM